MRSQTLLRSLSCATALAASIALPACTFHHRQNQAAVGGGELPSEAAGAGAFATAPPAGEKPPGDEKKNPVKPKVTADFKGPPSTNDWWSSLIWQYKDSNPYSDTMFPHPLALKAEAGGLGVAYPTAAKVEAKRYEFPYERDLLVSVEGLKADATRVDAYSDFAVTAAWATPGGGASMKATFGHGLPFVYVTKTSGQAVVEFARDLPEGAVFATEDGTLGVTTNGHSYGLFAPPGAAWKREGRRFVSDLHGASHYSVAALPDATKESLELFRKHAFAFVTDTHVTWAYDAKTAQLTTTTTAETKLVEQGPGYVDAPLLALYHHQWKASEDKLLAQTYVSSRGVMKLLDGRTFTTKRTFHGIVPMLPDVATHKDGDVRTHLKEVVYADDMFPPGLDGNKDSYWTGKSLGKVASATRLAAQHGDDDYRDKMVSGLKKELEDWFDGKAPHVFYYDKNWNTLIATPSAYQSGWQMNDHHFNYGYFVTAAATVAAYDPAWAKPEKFGTMVSLVIKDAANWDAADARFPRLRNFDAYAGHSWASGPAMFDGGNNEESSSEDINFAASVVLWGAETGDDKIRDLGIFLYETTVAATLDYWFDVDHEVFPKGFDHDAVGIVWGNGGAYDTWFDKNPVYIHGINFLPMTAASLYLGRRPEYARRNYAHLEKSNRGRPLQWREVMWMYDSLFDPDGAAKRMREDHYFEPEFGGSWAFTYHWIKNVEAMGSVDTSVTADTPTYTVFRKGATRTYAAYNPTASPLHVTFSDGATLDVGPRALGQVQRAAAAQAQR